jgi:hypothetical protein
MLWTPRQQSEKPSQRKKKHALKNKDGASDAPNRDIFQGHISRNCPDRPPKARATADEGPSPPKDQPPQYDDLKKGETIADYVMKLTDEEREVFLRKVIGDEGTSDFPNA